MEDREKDNPGGFESIERMCREADMSGVNKKTLECLIKVGALDDFGDRAALLDSLDRIVSLAQSEARLKNSNQSSMFDMFGDSMPAPLASVALPDIEATDREKEEWERELLGMSLSSINVLAAVLSSADSEHVVFKSGIEPGMAGRSISLVGQIASVTHRFTRQNKPFVIAGLALMDGQVEVFVWEDKLADTEGLWREGNIVAVAGTVRLREDEISVSCSNASEFSPIVANDDAPASPATAPVAQPAPVASEPVEAPLARSVEPVTDKPAEVAPARSVKEDESGYDGEATEKLARTPAATNGAPPDMPNAPVSSNGAANGHARTDTGLAHSKQPPPSVAHRLNIRIRESDDPLSDQMMLDDVKRRLLECEGDDSVTLEIASRGVIYRMEWASISVKASADLTEELVELLGDSGSAAMEPVA